MCPWGLWRGLRGRASVAGGGSPLTLILGRSLLMGGGSSLCFGWIVSMAFVGLGVGEVGNVMRTFV